MERWEAKVLSIFLTWIIIAFFALLPIKVSAIFESKGESGKRILGVISCFGGGVFFGTYLLHMAPEVRELLEESWLHPDEIDYPIPELMIGIGFFIVLFLEKIVITISKRTEKSSAGEIEVSGGVYKSDSNVSNFELANDMGPSNDKLPSVEGASNGSIAPGEDTTIHVSKSTDALDNSQGHSHHHGEGNRSIILILALSLHCIFEGMGVGLQLTTVGVWSLFIAIIAHEFVIAFSLGLTLVQHYSTKGVIICGVLYAAMTPTGIAIGTAIAETDAGGEDIDMINGILQGIAAGTFIYVTFFEILNAEIEHDTSWAKIVALTAGFFAMALLSLIPEEGDAEDDGNGTDTHSHNMLSPMYWLQRYEV